MLMIQLYVSAPPNIHDQILAGSTWLSEVRVGGMANHIQCLKNQTSDISLSLTVFTTSTNQHEWIFPWGGPVFSALIGA